jgi:hypothetical protein
MTITDTLTEATTTGLSTAHSLAMARSDIHNAVNADDDHRRRQYALSARDNAVTVLLEPTSQRSEREHAEYYLADAEAIIATTPPSE